MRGGPQVLEVHREGARRKRITNQKTDRVSCMANVCVRITIWKEGASGVTKFRNTKM